MPPLAVARRVAASVPDPELPVVTVEDLGILRDVALEDGRLTVTITPTYLGCPAMHVIEEDLRSALTAAGFDDVTVRVELAPPWTSDAITEQGRRKLAAAGIAPPQGVRTLPLLLSVACPHCGSRDTVRTAAFGATACKALYRCRACDDPFEYVKDV